MLSVYIHIPFCRRKCAYCDFFSVPVAGQVPAAYVDLLLRQLRFYAGDSRWQGPVSTLFLGGGTPSLLAPADLGRLLQAIDSSYGFAAGAELSLEANPETVTAAQLQGYRQAGINRLSLGVQGTRPETLRLLGRGHDVTAAAAAVQQARAAGIDRVAADLIFAVPGLGEGQLRDDVTRLLGWGVEHLSCYGLTFEPQTPLAELRRQGVVQPVTEEDELRQFCALHDQLTAAGLAHYEISNYALPGASCRHNQAYWRRAPVLALGAGGHAFVDRGWGERWAAPTDLAQYAARLEAGTDPMELLETFDRRGAMNETCYLALRTAEGVDAARFRHRFGCALEEAYPRARRQLGDALAADHRGWRLTLEGWLLYDHHVQAFL